MKLHRTLFTVPVLTILLGLGLSAIPHQGFAQDAPTLGDQIEARENNEVVEEEEAPAKSEQEVYLENLQQLHIDKTRELPFETYTDIPQAVLDEAEEFYEVCQKSYAYQPHYNCECLSTRFVDERIRLGPDTSQSQVISTIRSECIDAAASSGFAYDQCMMTGSLTYTGGEMTPEEYCECVGNNYAILIANMNTKGISSRTVESAMGSALSRCQEYPAGTIKPLRRLD